jgi:hypothetical protein
LRSWAAGRNPSSVWEDHSASGYDFEVTGSMVTHSAVNQSYNFANGSLEGGVSGSESTLDFETDANTSSGGTPISVVGWINLAGIGGIDSKGDNVLPGWGVISGTAGGGFGNLFQQVSNSGSERIFARWGPGGNRIPDVDNGDFHLWVWHADGTGSLGGTSLFINGSLTEATEDGIEDGLSSGESILNDLELRIGNVQGAGDQFTGEIGFLEVWTGSTINGLSPADYGAQRFNGGNPLRIPEPGTLALLGLGGLMVLLRRRTK